MAMTRTQSGREVRRQTYAPYISRSHSEKGSEHTGLTKYMSNTSLSFGEDELFTEDTKKLTKHISKDVNDVLGQTPPSFSRASFLLQKPKSEKAHVSIDMWKPTPDERFGITFETLRDKSIKGIVVADIQSEGLAARSKKLKVGDMLHAINGQAVSTPQAAATLLREAKGVVQLVITRANPMPRQREGDIGLIKSDTTNGEQGAKAEEEPGSNTTVVVSCSALILASKEIVSHAGGLAERLDELYHQLKAKEIKSAAALQQLGELVGQTTIEQAGLVIANAQLGTLPNGWVEYYDQENGRPYYYNARTRATTWYKPRKDQPPPPPPSRPSDAERKGRNRLPRRPSGRDSSPSMEVPNHTSQGHAVSEAIAAMQTKKKMVEAVQIECKRALDRQGLETVSL